MKTNERLLYLATVFMTSTVVSAATGEMGTGKPQFGVYSGNQTIVFSLADATINFPAGCTSIMLSASTFGIDSYKIAVAQLTAARLTGKRIRLYAHVARDGGCGADFIQILD